MQKHNPKNIKPAVIAAAHMPPIVRLKHGGTIHLNAEDDKAKKELLKTDPGAIMTSIIKQQRTLYAKQIADYQAARALAENPIYPQRALLFDIYADVILDPFIHGQIYNHRILPVKNKAFKINNTAGETDKEKVKHFQKSWFNDFITWALESKFFSFSLPYIEQISYDGKTSWIKKLTLLERKNVHPESNIITRYQSDFTGIDYLADPVNKFVIPIGDPFDLGLLLKAIPIWIIKKHGWQNWDEFGEIFGIPIRTAKTASQDPRVIAEIEGWLRDMSTAAYGLFPAGTELDIKESNKTDAFKVFSEAIKMANEELAILFSGQTMTSMDGSSRSQGEVHERVKDEITKDDEKFIRTIVNEQLIPLLRDVHGYPFDEGDSFEWDQPEDLQNLLKIFQGVNNMGFQLDPDQVTEKFGVKILGIKAPAVPNDEPDPKDKKDDKELSVTPGDLIKLHAKLQQEMFGGTA